MIIRKLFKAEVAHRLVSSYSKKCQSIHGHSYLFEVYLEDYKLNCDEMVLDFGELKDKINGFMDAWDHSLVISSNDPYVAELTEILEKGKMRYIVVPYNPTAEMMAVHIYRYLRSLSLPISKVRVHETATGWAEFDGGDVWPDLDNVYYSDAIGFKPESAGRLL